MDDATVSCRNVWKVYGPKAERIVGSPDAMPTWNGLAGNFGLCVLPAACCPKSGSADRLAEYARNKRRLTPPS